MFSLSNSDSIADSTSDSVDEGFVTVPSEGFEDGLFCVLEETEAFAEVLDEVELCCLM